MLALWLACQVDPSGVVAARPDPSPPGLTTSPTGTPPEPTEPAPPAPGAPELSLGTPTWDPLGPVPFSATATGELTAAWIEDGTGAVVRTLATDLAWDGRDDAGARLGTGSYRLLVEGPGGTTADLIRLVRPGIVSVSLATEGTEALFWSSDGVLQDLASPFTQIDAIDDGEMLLPFPPVSDDLVHAPVADAGPLVLSWDVAPVLHLEPAAESALGPTGFADGDIEVTVDGATVLSGSPVVPGAPVEVELPAATVVGVQEGDLIVRFWSAGQELASVSVPYRFYRTLGASTMGFEGMSYHPWPAMIDAALRAIDGTEPDHDAVASAVTEWVYYDLGLTYDTVSGASRYSEYGGFSWDEPRFYARDFLNRAYGNVINCSDAGNIVITYSNMLGAELHHIVILQNYDLNFLLAIGGDAWVSCPFGPGICGFSYHAVATDDGAQTVWDATAAVDGDDDPGMTPNTLLLVQALTGDDYLFRLVRSGNADYAYESRVEVQ
jgi:hypothetical protein